MTAQLQLGRSGAAHHRGASKQDYSTPWTLIAAVEKRFGGLAFDLAASPGNNRAHHYFTEREDALKQDWHKIPGLLWLNPPFASIAPWARKCREESARGARIAFLVPAAVGSNWFRDFVINRARVCFLNPRVSFDGKHPYPKDVMVCIFGMETVCEVWTWK